MNTQPAPRHQHFHQQNFDMLVFQQFSHISSELKPQKRHNTENEPEIRLQLLATIYPKGNSSI